MLSERIKQAIAEVEDFPRPGISFKDITPILADPAISEEILKTMAKWAGPLRPDFIAGIEARGFLMGFALAQRLGIGFIPLRKPDKLPREVFSESYDLEYGSTTLQMHKGDLKTGSRVIIHDDLLATGGTAEAAAKLCAKSGGNVVGMHFLIELSFLNGRNTLPPDINLHSEVNY